MKLKGHTWPPQGIRTCPVRISDDCVLMVTSDVTAVCSLMHDEAHCHLEVGRTIMVTFVMYNI